MTRRLSARALAGAVMIAAGLGIVLAGTAALIALYAPPDAVPPGVVAGLGIGGMVLGGGALWLLRDALDDHFRDIARLRGLAVVLRAGGGAPENFPEAEDRESGQLREALLSLAGSFHARASEPDRRLAAVLGAVSEAVIVVTAQGQVSLVNGAARRFLGAARVEVGTSVFAALAREPLEDAMAGARAGGGAVACDLMIVDGRRTPARVSALANGAVIAIRCDGAGAAGLEHDLSLHDSPPDAPAPDDITALHDLPLTVLDIESTGLDPVMERIVAIGAVRLHGATLFRAAALDCLVDPRVPIPRAATAIHGIADATVAGMPPFADQASALAGLIGDTVVVGHNIGFDLAILAAEAARAGVAWRRPRALDTLQLAAALDPGETALDLEDVAARHGVAVFGRHTALGDALVTAELWRRLMERLDARGVRTLGEAEALAATATRVISRQRAAGW